MPTHTMKVCKTTDKEIDSLFNILNEVEWLSDELKRVELEDVDYEDFEIFGKHIRTGDAETMLKDLVDHLAGIHFQRILTNLQVLLDNCADPDQRTVEFNPNIKQGLELLQKHRDTEPGTLVNAKPIEVNHAELERIGDSTHTSQCPECAPGTLPMRRDADGVLLKEDACLFCGQQFVYMDVETLK